LKNIYKPLTVQLSFSKQLEELDCVNKYILPLTDCYSRLCFHYIIFTEEVSVLLNSLQYQIQLWCWYSSVDAWLYWDIADHLRPNMKGLFQVPHPLKHRSLLTALRSGCILFTFEKRVQLMRWGGGGGHWSGLLTNSFNKLRLLFPPYLQNIKIVCWSLAVGKREFMDGVLNLMQAVIFKPL